MKRYIKSSVNYDTLIPFDELGPYINDLHWYRHDMEYKDGSAYPYIAYANKLITALGGPGADNNMVYWDSLNTGDDYAVFLATDKPLSDATLSLLGLERSSKPAIQNEFQFNLAVQYFYSGYSELQKYKHLYSIPEYRDPDTGLRIEGYTGTHEDSLSVDPREIQQFKKKIQQLVKNDEIPKRNSIIKMTDPYYGQSFWKVQYSLDDSEIASYIESEDSLEDAVSRFVTNIMLTEYGVPDDGGLGFGDMVGDWSYSSAVEARNASTEY